VANKDRMKPGDLVRSRAPYDWMESYRPIGFIAGLHPTRHMRRVVQWVYPTVFKETFVNIQDLKLISAAKREDLCK
jgi:hypothetical protein